MVAKIQSLALTLLAGFFLLGVAAEMDNDALADEDPNTQTVFIGTELDYPPYSFLGDDGKPTGYNVDLIRAVARVMHLDVDLKIAPWGEIRKALESGEIDAVAGMYFSLARDEIVDFTPSFAAIYHTAFVHDGSPTIESEADLRGLDIIVMQGDIMHDYVVAQGLCAQPVTVATPADALELLAEGNHDCALIAELPGLYWLKKLELSEIKMAPPQLHCAFSCFAVAGGNTELKNVLANGLAVVASTGEGQEIYDYWLGSLKPQGVLSPAAAKYVVLLVVLILSLLCFLLVRWLILRKQVAVRTEDLRERAKELQCMYSVSEALLRAGKTAELLHEVVCLIPPGWRFPEFTRARIRFDGQEYLSQKFSPTQWCLSAAIVIDGDQRGAVEVYTLTDHPAPGGEPHLESERNLIQIIGSLLSKTLQAKDSERLLLEKDTEYQNLFQGMLNGVALHEIICDEEGTPVDYRFLDINPAFERLTGLKSEMVLGKTVREVMPNIEPTWIQKYGQVALTGGSMAFEEHSQELGKYFAVSAFQHSPGRFACIFADITSRRSYEKSLADHRSRLQSLASQLANTEDRLRQDIAAGLHDSIGQDLAALKLTVDILRLNKNSLVDDGGEKIRRALDHISGSIDLIVQETWTLAFQLCPPGLYEAGLVPALEWLVEQFNSQHEIEFLVEVVDEPVQLSVQARGLLFQMIRELFGNAIKHAGPTRVRVELSHDDSFLTMAVIDDGCGFEFSNDLIASDSLGGFGLFSIRERLAFLAGKLEVESVAGEGTRITIYFPIGIETEMETESGHE